MLRRLLIGLALIAVVVAGVSAFRYVARQRAFARQYAELEQHRAEHRTQPAPAAATAAASPVPDYWTDFRGPARDGHYRERAIRTDWTGLQPIWKQPIGAGYASFSIGGGRAYTIEQRRGNEVVAAYDAQTGRELWTRAWTANFRESMGGDGPRATPTFHNGRVYALGAEGELECLDAATGAPVWTKNILRDAGASNLQWGMSGAPLIVDDNVIVQPGGPRGASIVAYDKATGALVWKALNDPGAYASPMLVTLAGRRQIVAVTATRAVGLSPENGTLLWDFPWENSAQINVAQPILVDDHRVFLSAAYGAGAVLFDVVASGAGFKTSQIWANSLMKNRFQTSVLLNGYVYGLDEGILACLDVNTGERTWKGGRYGYGQVLLAGDHLIVQTEEGELVLVAATPERFNEITRIDALHGRSWNVPAFADGRLLIRNATEMAAFDLRK